MSVILFNSSLEIGGWLNSATQNITGSMTVTVILVVLLLLCIGALFRIPLLFFLILGLPLLVVFALWDVTGGAMTILLIVIFIIGWALAKSMFGWR